MKKTSMLLAIFIGFILAHNLIVTCAYAESKTKKTPYSISVTTAYLGDAKFEGASGSFSAVNLAAEIEAYDFSVIYETETYNWNNKSELDFVKNGKTPWTALQKLGVQYGSYYAFDADQTVIYSVQISSQFENAITGDSMTIAGVLGYNYKISPNLNVSLGVAAGYNPLDWRILPAIGVQYFYDDWEVSLAFPFSYIGYKVTDSFSMRADVGIEGGVYRLSNNSDVEDEGYVKKEEIKCSLLADWKCTGNVKFSFGPQYIFARAMKFYTKSHNRTGSKEDIDGTWGITANVELTF